MNDTEAIREIARERLDLLPRNWRNIRDALISAIDESGLSYLDYMPRGRAADYMGTYNAIYDNLDKYARKVGIRLKFIAGKNGGRWTSKWVLAGVDILE